MQTWQFAQSFYYGILSGSPASQTGIAVRHALSWSDLFINAASHSLSWGDWLIKRRHSVLYGGPVAAAHELRYTDMVAVRHESKWSLIIAKRMVAAYSQPVLNTVRMLAKWSLTADNAARCEAIYSLLAGNPAQRRHDARWDIRDQNAQIVQSDISLTYGMASLGVIAASLSSDEGSPLWVASVTLESVDDFDLLAPGALVTLALAGEAFSLVVDSRQLVRPGPTNPSFMVSLSSPLSLKDSPFAATISVAWDSTTSAKAAVEEMLGPVDWRLPDWVLPAGSATYSGATPLAIARGIVSSVGGIVESNPDGSVVCRPRHYYSPPSYDDSPVGLVLTDADLLMADERQSAVKVTNRFAISNELAGDGGADKIEFIADAADDNAGHVRAYPVPWRDVELVHAGDVTVAIAGVGEVVRTEEEIIDIVGGVGSTVYPIHEVVDYAWRYADLGDILVSGASVRAASAGYSLLRIKYKTRALTWAVSNTRDEDVLFLMMEA